ncbi:transposase [Xanthomonas campestris pv. campestris]|nr:transposase [Xanthomonas campestris pv. campestris]
MRDLLGHHYCLLIRMACERFAVHVHAFVLMDNHVHLLVAADKAGVKTGSGSLIELRGLNNRDNGVRLTYQSMALCLRGR